MRVKGIFGTKTNYLNGFLKIESINISSGFGHLSGLQ
jgi:hypothetical protein